MERSKSVDDDDGDNSIPVAPLQFHEYDKDIDMQNIQPVQSASPTHRTKLAQPSMQRSEVPKVMYRAKSADHLNRLSSSMEMSPSPCSSHNTSLEDFKAKAKRKGIIPLPYFGCEEELKTKQNTILKLQKENEELKMKITSSYDGSYKDDFLQQIETISKLKLDCVLKQNEVDRLKAVEVTLKQTKQVLKDTTWALTVKEEELKNIKGDMRDNYESRLSELILRLNDRELKLASMTNERDSLAEEKRDGLLRIDELTKQVSCYEQELDAKNKELESSEAEVSKLLDEKRKLHQNSVNMSAKVESLVEQLREMEKKIEDSSNAFSNEQLPPPCHSESSTELLQAEDEPDANAPQASDPGADGMSLEQITLMIQDNANLRLLVEESKESLKLFMEKSQTEKKELQEEAAEKGDHINQLMQLVNSLRAQLPLNDSAEISNDSAEIYSTDKDEPAHDDEVKSLPSDDEGTTSMKQQMKHTISNYEKRITELQSLYDNDVFTLENEKTELQREVKELQSNYQNISHTNNSFASDYEEMKRSYDEKLHSLKTHYEDLLHKECVSAQQQQTELVAENSKLQFIVEEAEKKFMQHLQQMQENFNTHYQTDLTSELRKVFAEQTSTVSAIKEELRQDLSDIKSIHSEDLSNVEQEFGMPEMNRCGLDDTYSNEILKLTEERNDAQKAAHLLREELENVQQEYDTLKDLYDALSSDVGEYKNEKLQLISQISILSEQSSNLKSSLRDRRNEVDEYKSKINNASKSIEDYTMKLIEKSESSSNANDSLRSELGNELGDFPFGRNSPIMSASKKLLTRKRSSTLIEQVKVLRSNLDDAKSELKNLHEEHGLSTLVFERLSGILNLLRKYIDSEILEDDKGDEDKSDKSVDNQDSLKLLSENELDLNKLDIKHVKPLNASSFEISENLSIDDSDLSDATASGLTQQEFEKDLYDLKIDIPFDYCDSLYSQNLNKHGSEEANTLEKCQVELSNLRKQNAVLEQRVLWLQKQLDVPALRENFSSGDTFPEKKVNIIEGVNPLEESMERTPTGSICGEDESAQKLLVDDATHTLMVDDATHTLMGDDATQTLHELQSKLKLMQQENDSLKTRLQSKEDTNQEENEKEVDESASSVATTIKDGSYEEVEKLQGDNSALKDKIAQLEKEVFGTNINMNSTCNQSAVDTPASDRQKLPSDVELFNTNGEDVFLKLKFREQERELTIPGLSSVKLSDNLFDNLPGNELFDEEFDWDISRNSLGEQDSTGDSKNHTAKQMDSEGHTLKERDSLSKSFSDLENENESLRRENVSLKEEAERDSKTIIGPGFTSEILYYEHAQPVDGDSVGIKVDAIKTLLNNVVVSQGNEAVSFQEYEGREVILRLLLDIQVEVVDLLKENQVLKETDVNVKTKPCAISSSVQTGESITELNGDDDVDSIADVEEMSLNNLQALGGSDSSLSEQDLLCSTILEEQSIRDVVDKQSSHIKEVDEDTVICQEIESVDVEQPCDGGLLPGLTSTVKDDGVVGDTGLHIEIVSLEGDDAHIMVKVREKRRKLVLRRFSSILGTQCQNDDVPNVEDSEVIYLSESSAFITDKNGNEELTTDLNAFSCHSCLGKVGDRNESGEFGDQNERGLVAGLSSEFSFNDAPCVDVDTLTVKMSKMKTLFDNLFMFGQNDDGGFEKHEPHEHDFPSAIFTDFQDDVFKLQKENDALKLEVEKERRAKRSSSVESLNRSMEVIPGFSSDCLLQEQSINSVVSVGDKDDALTMLIENLIIFEGSEETGFKTSDGNNLSKSFIADCQSQLVNLRKENADLKLQMHDQSNTSLQQCLDGEHLPSTPRENEITPVTHFIDDSLSDVGQTFAFTESRKPSGEKVQRQQSFIIPGFSKELLNSDSAASDVPLLLENVVLYEGNEHVGFTKSEENDINNRLLNEFKTKIVDLINENNVLKGKIEKIETMHGAGENGEEMHVQKPIFARLEIDDDDVLNKELEVDLFVPGFSSKLLLTEDGLPFSEVDSLTRKLDALKDFLKSIVIFKGNERSGYTKYTDTDLSVQLLNDFESEVAQVTSENALLKERLEVFSIADNSTVSLIPCFSSEIDQNSILQFSTTQFANLREENVPHKNEKQEGMDNSMANRKRSQYLNSTKNQLVELLVKKNEELDRLTGTQPKHEDVECDNDKAEGVPYEESIQKAKEWMESINFESLTQLRADLDQDYIERIKIVEEKLQEVYRLRMKKARVACDEKISKMKRDYEEEIARLQSKEFLEDSEGSLESYMESLDESIATLIDDTREETKDSSLTDDTKDTTMTDDESITHSTLDGETISVKKQDKCVNTTASFGSDNETQCVEKKEIDKLKESIIDLFTKPVAGSEEANVLFRLDDVEGILQENYDQITDMTDKIKWKLCDLEKDMIVNFENTIKEKEREFEVERNELIFKTKNELLKDVCYAFSQLIEKRVEFVDNRLVEVIAQNEEDMKVISQAAECSEDNVQDGTEKFIHKLEDFFRGDIGCMLNGSVGTGADKESGEYDGNDSYDYDEDGLLFKIDGKSSEEMLNEQDSAIWNEFFKDEDCMPRKLQVKLTKKKIEFKSSIEEKLNMWAGHVTGVARKLCDQYAQFNEIQMKRNASKTSHVISNKAISSLVNAHTEMVLKTSLQNVEGKHSSLEIDIISKVGEFLVNQMDAGEISRHKSLYDDIVQKYEHSEMEKCKMDEFEKEIDEVTKSCVDNAVQTLLEMEDGKKVRFISKGERGVQDTESTGGVDDTTGGDEITRLKNIHTKEINELREQLHSTVAKMVKQATDDKFNEFQDAKMDLVKQHHFILDEFITEQEKEIGEIRKDHEGQLQELKCDYVKQLNELKENAAKQSSEDDEISKAVNDEENIKMEFKQQLDALKKQHSDELSKQREAIRSQFEEEHIENLSNLQKQIEEDHTNHLKVLSDCQQNQLVEIQELKMQHESFVQNVQLQHNEETEKLKKDIRKLEDNIRNLEDNVRNLEDNISTISSGILDELEVLEELRIPMEDVEEDSTLTWVSLTPDVVSKSITNSYHETQKNVKKQYNSQLDVLLNLFDSVLENVSSKITLPSDSFSSELLLVDNASSKGTSSRDSIIKPTTIHNEIENTFKVLQTQYEAWYAGLRSELESHREEISRLKRSCENSGNDKETIKEQALEIEALKCSISNQQVSIESLKEQLIKKQMVMDAKECQLIEMEEQARKEHQKHIVELEEAADKQIAAHKSLEGKSKEMKELNGLLQSKLTLISELEDELNKQQLLATSKENEVNEEMNKQKEKYEEEYKKLFSDKGNEVSAMYNELEGTLKDKDVLENLVKTQEESMLKLNEELNKFNDLSDAKENKMAEHEQQLRDEIERLEKTTLSKENELINTKKMLVETSAEKDVLQHELSKYHENIQKLEDKHQSTCEQFQEQVEECNVLIEQRRAQLEMMEEQLEKERDTFTLELSDVVFAKDKEITSMRSALDESALEKSVLENDAFKHHEELQCIADDKEKLIESLHEELTKQKERHASDLKELSDTKGKEIIAIFNELEGKLKEKDLLEDLADTQKHSILKLEEEVESTKEHKQTEREELLKKDVENTLLELQRVKSLLQEASAEKSALEKIVAKQQEDASKWEEQIKSYQKLIEGKNAQCSKIRDDMMVEKGRHVLELDKVTSTKNEELSNIQIALEEISKQKDEIEELVNLKQAYISKLEEELKECKLLIQNQVELLADIEEQLAKEREEYALNVKRLAVKKSGQEDNLKVKNELEGVIKKQLSDIGELCEEKRECKVQIDENQMQLSELEAALVEERSNYCRDIGHLEKEKGNEIRLLQDELEELMIERDELREKNENNDAMLDKLQEEFNEVEKLIIEDKEGHQLELEKISRDKTEQVSALQNELDKVLKDKTERVSVLQNQLDKVLKEKIKLQELGENHVATIGSMEENVREIENNLQNVSRGKTNEIVALQVEIERILKDNDELKERYEKEISRLQEQRMMEKQGNKSHLESISNDKSAEISALQNELDKQSEEKEQFEAKNNKHVSKIDHLNKQISEMERQRVKEEGKHQLDMEDLLVKNLESSDEISKLEALLNDSKSLIEESLIEKEEEVPATQEKTIEERDKSVLHSEIDALNRKVHEAESELANEKRKHQLELLSLISDQNEKVQSLQQSVDKISKEKGQIEIVLDKQQHYIGELEEQISVSKQFLDEKQVQLDNIEFQLEREKDRHSTDVEKVSKDIKSSHNDLEIEKERYLSELGKVLASQEGMTKGHEQNIEQKIMEIEDLKSLVEKQKVLTRELETVVEEKTMQLDESEQTNAEHVLELKKEVNELSAKIGKQEKLLKEKNRQESDLSELAEKQKCFICELETKVQAHQLLLKDKKQELCDLKLQLSEERNQHMLDYEQSAAKQKETIANMEKVLEGEIEEKKALKDYVESQEVLANQLKMQLDEHKLQIMSKENLLAEMKSLQEKSLEKRNADLEHIALEKSNHISNVEKSLEEVIEKKKALENNVQKQEAVINDLEKQLNKYKEQEDLLNGVKNKYADELTENKATITQQKNHLIEVNAQHAEALEKLQREFDDAAEQREEQITVLEGNIADQIKEADELKDIVKRQQALVCELDQQLNEEKTLASVKEKESGEMKETIAQKANNDISESRKELSDVKEKLKKAEEDAKKHLIQITELEEQLNEQSVLLYAKDHEFVETKETMVKEHGELVQQLESDKQSLIDNVNNLEENVRNLQYGMKEKSEELGEVQKSQQQMQLEHINEIMKLNNEHRKQMATLMEIPQKDRNIKSLLLDLQKEADEVLDLVINVPEINENSSVEQIECLKSTWLQEKEMLLGIIDDLRKNTRDNTATEMSTVSNANMSTEAMEDFLHDQNGEMSIASMASMASDIQGNKRDESEATSNTRLGGKDAFLQDNRVISEFEKLLSEESNKVEALCAKLEEQVDVRESMQASHERELAKLVERELNLKEKYIKVTDLLQKEKNAKTRVMEMLNDAQKLNEIQSQNLEEVQNDKNSLLESYTMLSELENLVTKEREKTDLINAKLEKERYEKASLQTSLSDEKAELKATKEREMCLKEKCKELSKLFENETELRKNIADALESEKKIITMEKKNLEQKECALNQRVAELGNDNFADKFKSLKAWEGELKKREKSLAGKEEKVKILIERIEQGYDILPQKQEKDYAVENKENGECSCSDENEWLLDTKHLPLVADLNQKIKNLQKEKVKLVENLSVLKDEIVDYKKQLKQYQKDRNICTDKEINGQTTENKEDNVTSDGQKLLNAGWTIAKVQRLYLKYFRAESFRKALVYQKRYLTLMLNENDSQPGSVNNWLNSGKRKYTFKVVVLAVISIRRMKYLVKKYHRNLHKSSPEYQYKDKARNNTNNTNNNNNKKKSVENVIDDKEHSPLIGSNENRNVPKSPHSSVNSLSRPANGSYNANSTHAQTRYVPSSTQLPSDEPVNIQRSHHVEPEWSNQNEMWVNGIPRSYPRPSGIHPDEFPSKISRTNGDSTLNNNNSNSRIDKSPHSSTPRPFVAHPTPLLSSTSRDIRDNQDEQNESLSTYIQTLETLQNRLKNVGYSDRSRPSLL